MERFFAEKENVTLGILIVDSRHKPTADDVTMASWFKATGRPAVLPRKEGTELAKRGIPQ